MKTEKGQALILIAFGIVAILGLTALAIDGGNAFADRRHAQNAADNAALAAALTRLNNGDWQQAAFTRAADNTYDNNGVSNEVFVHNPPIEGPYACPAHRCNDYIQVIIESRVDTWFARIVGVEFVNNRVHAIARAKPRVPYFDGHAIVALSPGGGPKPAIRFRGASELVVTGSGVLSNSSDACAVSIGNNVADKLDVPYLNAPGAVCDNNGNPIGGGNTTQFPYPPSFSEFDVDELCSRSNVVKVTETNKDFPSGTGHTIQNDTIYCISGNFKITTGGPYSATNVTFVIFGDLEVTGGTLILSSPPDLPLFYLPYKAGNPPNSNVKINGNSGSSLRGMLLAPDSDCDISGGSGTGITGQVICYTVDITGGSESTVEYNDEDNPDDPPHVELTQ
jgi:hypothetical protein